ncbi:MAG TPA: GGDEF domain-containing protein [Acidimicrobiia bacterium]
MAELEVTAPGGRARPRGRRGLKARGGIFVTGAVAGLAIVIATLVVVNPLLETRTDLHQIASDGVPLQEQLVALRTTVVEWQFYIERHLDTLTPGVAPDPTELVKGGQLVTTQTAQAQTLSRHLRSVGFTSDARNLDETMRVFNTALAKLTPVASGKHVDAATLRTFVSAERTALEDVWALTTQIGTHLSEAITTSTTNGASGHLTAGLRLFLGGVGLSVIAILGAAIVFGRRAGRRERAQRRETHRHEYEARVQEALEMTKTEPDVYAILGEGMSESVPHLKVEMLIADSSRAHFRRALTNGSDFEGCKVLSPLDCPAATVGHALVFPSSSALNACPYLKSRPSGACSAACLPVSIAGRTVGVTHAIGRDGVLPALHDVETLNFTSRRGSERIAMIRAFATSETQAQTDPLTGLFNRRSLQNIVRDLHEEGVPYALAYGDLDHFKILNDTHGHEAGDQALRLFARVLGDSLRPKDIAARYGGEEFVIVLPECGTAVATGVLERVRESLALALSAGRVPPFTVTFGVASSVYAEDFEEIVAIADGALLDAKAAGRNRVTVATLDPDGGRRAAPALSPVAYPQPGNPDSQDAPAGRA